MTRHAGSPRDLQRVLIVYGSFGIDGGGLLKILDGSVHDTGVNICDDVREHRPAKMAKALLNRLMVVVFVSLKVKRTGGIAPPALFRVIGLFSTRAYFLRA
jgi:hypothetical protein